jgi:ABC-type transporter Mla subunit MlaD
VKGKQIRAQTRKYEAVFEFQLAQGITVGTPVRIRGVDVGNVVQVRPSLEKIDVVVELSDAGIVVPRNALVEVNQSGLISETLIDVTPRRPIPKPTVGPLDPKCPSEGLIVCDRERIKGEQGVSLDELVGICTKIARQIDGLGVERMASMAERLGDAVQEARPLLLKVQSMAEDVEPLLKEVREGGLLKDFEKLTKVAAEAGRDLSNLNKVVLTSDNTELLRDSVSTLTKTLKYVESISKDVSGVTGDAKTRNNLRQLIESLSRLVTD